MWYIPGVHREYVSLEHANKNREDSEDVLTFFYDMRAYASPCLCLMYVAHVLCLCFKAAGPVRLQLCYARPANSKFFHFTWKIRRFDGNNSGFADEERSDPC